jgi:L-lysine exporter family protein LysE/ArgO
MTGSFLFFFALGYGAKYLRPVFTSPTSWRVLEALIAVTMWAIALKLIMGL